MQNISKLQDADACGVGWLDANWHFAGNFWMARADWINKLPSPIDYRYKMMPEGYPPGLTIWGRMGAELWVGSNHDIRAVSLACHNKWIWGGRLVYRYLADKIKECAGRNLGAAPAPEPSPMATALSRPAVVRALMRPNSLMRRRLVG